MLWSVTALAVAAALAMLLYARRLAAQLARLSTSYWELRYEQGQLASRLERLEGQLRTSGQLVQADEPAPASPRSTATTAFVPLSSLKKTS